MDDTDFFKWLFGTFLTVWYFVTRWTHARTTSAHQKIEEDRRDNGRRFANAQKETNEVLTQVTVCKEKIEEKLAEHAKETMTEPHIIQYVDTVVGPLKELRPKVDEIQLAVARIEEALKK